MKSFPLFVTTLFSLALDHAGAAEYTKTYRSDNELAYLSEDQANPAEVLNINTSDAISDCENSHFRDHQPQNAKLQGAELFASLVSASQASDLLVSTPNIKQTDFAVADFGAALAMINAENSANARTNPCTRFVTPLPGSMEVEQIDLAKASWAAGQYQPSLSSLSGGASASSGYIQAAGGIATITFATLNGPGPWVELYEYDVLGRLRKVTYPDASVSDYTIDNAGNRTNVTTTAVP